MLTTRLPRYGELLWIDPRAAPASRKSTMMDDAVGDLFLFAQVVPDARQHRNDGRLRVVYS